MQAFEDSYSCIAVDDALKDPEQLVRYAAAHRDAFRPSAASAMWAASWPDGIDPSSMTAECCTQAIAAPDKLTSDPLTGRLTLNGFFTCRRNLVS